ncbi:hypothetical protein NS228_28920 [Methylobacterium indicum]|uniref:hypothetical protein n=1 Tax=Methylobacterium indicum TaxID=1775910 RepID=UPI000734BE0D|nr:hypothetical protein [Methylobacterium indicum]KTS14985.1 hypothetical protein NS228_28920 [Methylobacterium indicum]KTS37740.1 hypothetical protein NS229_06240 [Methylobacterium indicum]KTS48820.1 hypothetical protein NS230_18540 [Methylobacterium indicum]
MTATNDDADRALAAHVSGVLRHIWDPIGMRTEGPRDAYDRYIPGIVALLRGRSAYETAIVEHLIRIENLEMRLSARTRVMSTSTRAARALLGLREACLEAPHTLVAQIISRDGQHCIWIFRRSDGLHSYQHALFQSENDENGEYSWWADARDGRPGLFATATAAEAEARAIIGWLRTCDG